jgi:cation diffusion facilitator family transporter
MEENEKIGAYSIGVNLTLVGIKAVLGFLSGSVALLADAIHSSTDVISSITVLAGIKISKRKSKHFPYGLNKVENFVSLISAILIFLAGYKIVYTAFFEHQSLKTSHFGTLRGRTVLLPGLCSGKRRRVPFRILSAQPFRR